MIFLAVAALAFGYVAYFRFSAAPFIAGNLIVTVAVAVMAYAGGSGVGRALLHAAVTMVALQAGYVIGVMREARNQRSASTQPAPTQSDIAGDRSTMDRPG